MKFLKLKLHENCQMLAVVDDADNVLSAAAFTSSQDTEAAEGFAHTLLANLGLVKTADLPRTKTISELLDAIEETYGAFEFFVKDLTQSV